METATDIYEYLTVAHIECPNGLIVAVSFRLLPKVFRDRQCTYQSRKAWHHPPLFEVGLSIQIGCFHVAHSIRVGRVQEQDVSWDDLVREHSHKIPHPYILPSPLHQTHLFPVRGRELMPHTDLF